MNQTVVPELLIKHGSVVTAGHVIQADVAVIGEHIQAIGRDLPYGPSTRVVNARGQFVLPGVIDSHIHPTGAETFGSVSIGAAHGGTTTLLHFFYPDPARPWTETVEPAIAEAKATSALDFGFHLRLRKVSREVHQVPAAIRSGIVSFKMFMAYAKDDIMVDDGELYRGMAAIGEHGGLAMVHAENGLVIDYLEDAFIAAGKTTPEYYLPSRPATTEVEAIHRATRLAEMAGCRLYLPHLSAAEGLDEIRRARDRGVPVYAETCPHYLLLTNDDLLADPPFAKIGPPLRTAADRDALWRAIADGTIDTVASDHGSLPREQKIAPDGNIFTAGFGVPGAETLLPLLYDSGVASGRITLPRLVELLAEAPARIFGLAGRKGTIVPGADADLIVWDPRGTTTITAAGLHSNVFFTPYEGRTCRGRLTHSFQRGRPVIEDSRLVARPGTGSFLIRENAPRLSKR